MPSDQYSDINSKCQKWDDEVLLHFLYYKGYTLYKVNTLYENNCFYCTHSLRAI